jgi:hypothetical protein
MLLYYSIDCVASINGEKAAEGSIRYSFFCHNLIEVWYIYSITHIQ